jgi:hypothetical protein
MAVALLVPPGARVAMPGRFLMRKARQAAAGRSAPEPTTAMGIDGLGETFIRRQVPARGCGRAGRPRRGAGLPLP